MVQEILEGLKLLEILDFLFLRSSRPFQVVPFFQAVLASLLCQPHLRDETNNRLSETVIV